MGSQEVSDVHAMALGLGAWEFWDLQRLWGLWAWGLEVFKFLSGVWGFAVGGGSVWRLDRGRVWRPRMDDLRPTWSNIPRILKKLRIQKVGSRPQLNPEPHQH